MKRLLVLFAIVAGVYVVETKAVPQETLATTVPVFEVASVKIARAPASDRVSCLVPCTAGERLTVRGSRVAIRYMPLYQLVAMAYRTKLHQLSGPNWMRSQRFDIDAKIPEGVSKGQIPEMLQALLAERFKLSIHREEREQPVYALMLARGGRSLKASAVNTGPAIPDKANEYLVYTPEGEAHVQSAAYVSGPPIYLGQIKDGPHGPVRISLGEMGTQMEFLKITMPGLAEVLTPSLDRVVVDMTGLHGTYQVPVVWKVPPPEGSGGSGRPLPAPPPALVISSLEKAGLKLEARKAPVEIIVVDHLEKMPSTN